MGTYFVLSILVYIDIGLRVLVFRIRFFYDKGVKWLNIYDLTIVILDLLLNLTAVAVLAFGTAGFDASVETAYFGSFLVLRILYVSF